MAAKRKAVSSLLGGTIEETASHIPSHSSSFFYLYQAWCLAKAMPENAGEFGFLVILTHETKGKVTA